MNAFIILPEYLVHWGCCQKCNCWTVSTVSSGLIPSCIMKTKHSWALTYLLFLVKVSIYGARDYLSVPQMPRCLTQQVTSCTLPFLSNGIPVGALGCWQTFILLGLRCSMDWGGNLLCNLSFVTVIIITIGISSRQWSRGLHHKKIVSSQKISCLLSCA